MRLPIIVCLGLAFACKAPTTAKQDSKKAAATADPKNTANVGSKSTAKTPAKTLDPLPAGSNTNMPPSSPTIPPQVQTFSAYKLPANLTRPYIYVAGVCYGSTLTSGFWINGTRIELPNVSIGSRFIANNDAPYLHTNGGFIRGETLYLHSPFTAMDVTSAGVYTVSATSVISPDGKSYSLPEGPVPTSIKVVGADIYVGALLSDGFSRISVGYFKNQEAFKLLGEGDNISMAKAKENGPLVPSLSLFSSEDRIDVDGETVTAVGVTAGGYRINGKLTRVMLPSGYTSADVKSIHYSKGVATVSGSLGPNMLAFTARNGVVQLLAKENAERSFSVSVDAVGNDVYATGPLRSGADGIDAQDMPGYWKNGLWNKLNCPVTTDNPKGLGTGMQISVVP